MDIELQAWDDSGLTLLRALNAPHQKRYLGGPEKEEKILTRHTRYLRLDTPGATRMLRIVIDGTNVGSIGYWERDWQGLSVYETGWEVLAAFQGQGVASRAALRLIAELKASARHRWLYAFPSPENAASNALCRHLGFDLAGVEDFEYPPGVFAPHNAWRLDLSAWIPPAA
jgi:RimJ/RimL family protein N-acetyltransferase